MWPFKSKKHLKYDSVDAWIEGEKIPIPFSTVKDEKLCDELFTKLGELRQHLFNRHLEQLSETEREQLKAEEHASQSHEHIETAKVIAKELAIELSRHKYVVDVFPGLYHMNRIVLDVVIENKSSLKLATKTVPQFFKGFEVMTLTK